MWPQGMQAQTSGVTISGKQFLPLVEYLETTCLDVEKYREGRNVQEVGRTFRVVE